MVCEVLLVLAWARGGQYEPRISYVGRTPDVEGDGGSSSCPGRRRDGVEHPRRSRGFAPDGRLSADGPTRSGSICSCTQRQGGVFDPCAPYRLDRTGRLHMEQYCSTAANKEACTQAYAARNRWG